MPFKYKRTVAYLYHKFLTFFTMSGSFSEDLYPELGPLLHGPMHINQFSSHLKDLYGMHGAERMAFFAVHKIRLEKYLAGTAPHEYIVAEVHGHDGIEFSLCFERLRGDTIDTRVADSQGPRRLPFSSPSTTPSESQTSSASPSNKPSEKKCSQSSSRSLSTHSQADSLKYRDRNAKDEVALLSQDSGFHSTGHKTCLVLSFNQTLPRLYELAVLARTIHDLSKSYSLLSDNCYFFASSIVKVLKERYAPSEEKFKQAGSWNGINANKKIDVHLFNERFQTNKEAFEQSAQTLEDMIAQRLVAAAAATRATDAPGYTSHA